MPTKSLKNKKAIVPNILTSAFLVILIFILPLFPLSGCQKPCPKEEIHQTIQKVWASTVISRNNLETQSKLANTPLREKISKEEFTKKFPTIPWTGEGGGPTSQETNITVGDYIVPLLIIYSTTPENIQRNLPYSRCGIVFPKEIGIPNYFILPKEAQSQIELNIGNTGPNLEYTKVVNPPILHEIKTF